MWCLSQNRSPAMNGRAAPSVNLEKITCVIRCCACPPAPASADEIDGGGECEKRVDDGRCDEKGSKCSRAFEENLHGPEKPSKFFIPLLSVFRSKKNQFKNKIEGRNELARDTEILHFTPQTEDKIQKEKGSD